MNVRIITKVQKILMVMLALSPTYSLAGGISLGATRVIYPANAAQTSLAITNSDESNKFLIQSWIEDENGKKTDDFIITPPLFVSKPKSENTLRIIYSGKKYSGDTEKLYWLNSKAIPSVELNDIKDKNVLQIAVLARMKMFLRPVGLRVKSSEAASMLKFRKADGKIMVTNDSPFYVTLVNMKLDDEVIKVPNIMVSPKSQSSIPLTGNNTGTFAYQTINDYGANTPVIKFRVN